MLNLFIYTMEQITFYLAFYNHMYMYHLNFIPRNKKFSDLFLAQWTIKKIRPILVWRSISH